jgi:trimeric autotransporter adhesin
VLTRASDADTYAPQSDTGLGGGDYFFVQSGSTYGFSSFVCTNDGTITFGTTAITFQLFSTVPSYNVTSPLDLTGNTLSLAGVVAATNGGTGTATVTTGDLLYGSASNTWSKLAIGSAYKSLVVNGAGTNVEWNAVALNQSGAVSGNLPATNGGTGQGSYAVGDILYSDSINALAKLSGNTTTTKKFLTQTGTGSASAAPSWNTVDLADISGLGTMSGQDADAVAITGGTASGVAISGGSTIDNSVIGGTTPASVTGTVVIASNGLMANATTVSTNYSLPSGNNALSAGPITVNSGVTVTIPSGSVWTVV